MADRFKGESENETFLPTNLHVTSRASLFNEAHANGALRNENGLTHQLDTTDMEGANISEGSKAKLRKIVEQAPFLDKNELSFMGLSIRQNENDGITTTLLVRNGTMEDLQLKQVPLVIYDAAGDVAAKGTFRLAHLTIKANTSKPMTLVFPKNGIIKADADFSGWRIETVSSA
jgi:SLAP domain-containing protein